MRESTFIHQERQRMKECILGMVFRERSSVSFAELHQPASSHSVRCHYGGNLGDSYHLRKQSLKRRLRKITQRKKRKERAEGCIIF